MKRNTVLVILFAGWFICGCGTPPPETPVEQSIDKHDTTLNSSLEKHLNIARGEHKTTELSFSTDLANAARGDDLSGTVWSSYGSVHCPTKPADEMVAHWLARPGTKKAILDKRYTHFGAVKTDTEIKLVLGQKR